ncbi:hypothetical protein MT325_m611L [Paramecium bursaria chlorella virus MT325]|uniref:Uncharacterized protein m611L n=1 Tax=Paramecium bursaria Chlorella virus MT325 TaxID=346932 RepID=A7IUZ1_PBCVM|nr:hypothetical protein MT325_m611L [Paramecium bursaria chlorella virus MT325]
MVSLSVMASMVSWFFTFSTLYRYFLKIVLFSFTDVTWNILFSATFVSSWISFFVSYISIMYGIESRRYSISSCCISSAFLWFFCFLFSNIIMFFSTASLKVENSDTCSTFCSFFVLYLLVSYLRRMRSLSALSGYRGRGVLLYINLQLI